MREMTHQLKTDPEPFQLVWTGLKTWEMRRNDRDFRLGDVLVLEEYGDGEYTGRSIEAVVHLVSPATWGKYGIPAGYVIMQIEAEQLRD